MDKRIRVGVACALAAGVLTACGSGGPEPGRDRAAEAEVRAAVDSLFAAMNAGDPDEVLAHYLPGEDFVHVACTTIRFGRSFLERVLPLWYTQNPGAEFEHEVVAVRMLGPGAAAVTARGRSSVSGPLFWTWVLRREGEGWAIVQEHESWPGCSPPSEHPAMESGEASTG